MKDRCSSIRNLLQDSIDGQLSAKKNALVAQHIATCEKCAQQHEMLVFIQSSVKQMKQAPLPEEFSADLKTKLAALPTPAKRKRIPSVLQPYSFITAGVVIALFLGTGYYKQYVGPLSQADLGHQAEIVAPETAVPQQSPVATVQPSYKQPQDQVVAQPKQPIASPTTEQTKAQTPSSDESSKKPLTETGNAPLQQPVAPQTTAAPNTPEPSPKLVAPAQGGASAEQQQNQTDEQNQLFAMMRFSPEPETADDGFLQYTLHAQQRSPFAQYITQTYAGQQTGNRIELYLSDDELDDLLSHAEEHGIVPEQNTPKTELTSHLCIILLTE